MLVNVLLILVSLFLHTQSEEGSCRTNGSTSYCSKFTLQPGQNLKLTNSDGIITELYFEDCSFSSIPSEFFQEFRKVEKIDMMLAEVYVIESDAFQGLKHLKILRLTGNKIHEIQGNLFTDLVSLEELYMAFNNLIEITPDAFVSLNKLKSLDLAFNEIETIHPQSFVSLTNLQALDISFTSINGLKPCTFETMGNLTVLILDHSKLFKIESNLFRGLKSLQYLYVSASMIRHLESNCFTDLSELISLDLGINFLETIPVGVFANLHKLEELKLNHNDLISLSKETFFGLIRLKTLFINNNKISQLDAENLLTQLPNLDFIKLNDNAWQCDHLKNNLGEFYKRPVEIYDNYTRFLPNFNGIACSNEKLIFNPISNTAQETPPKKQENTCQHSNYHNISHIIENIAEAYEEHPVGIAINLIVVWVSLLTIILIIAFVGISLYRRTKLSFSRSGVVQYNKVVRKSGSSYP